MALIVFLRGVNVGGHRTFRPSILAKELSAYDVTNVGSAGTFVVHKPRSEAKFRAALLRKLPFTSHLVFCDARDIVCLAESNPFAKQPEKPNTVCFVSILPKGCRTKTALPVAFPRSGKWLVKVISKKNQFVFGLYRRHMKTIGFLGNIDALFNAPVTTRNWNTIMAIHRVLKNHGACGP